MISLSGKIGHCYLSPDALDLNEPRAVAVKRLPKQRSPQEPEGLESIRDYVGCLVYTSDADDDMQCVELGGRRSIKK